MKMTKNRLKNHIFILIGIFCFIPIYSNILNSLPTPFKTIDQSMDVKSATILYDSLDFSARWGGNNYDRGNDIQIDASGNIYITGETQSYGGGADEAFVLKYNKVGVLQWDITWGGNSYDTGEGIALCDSGSIFITGYTDSFDVGNGDAMIVKYNSAGIQQWNTTWGGSNFDKGYAIEVDSAGDVFVTGHTYSYGAGLDDVFILKYNSEGNLSSNFYWGGSDYDRGYDIMVDDTGNIYITGETQSYGAGYYDAFIAKFNSAGILQWNTTWGGSDHEVGYGIALDNSDNVYISGRTHSFGAGFTDAFLVKYDNEGILQWSTTWGTSLSDYGCGIALDASGDIYIAGHSDTGNSPFPGQTNYDIFVAKYNNAGTLLFNTTWGSIYFEMAQNIASDNSGDIYITGLSSDTDSSDSDAFFAKFSFTEEIYIPGYNLIFLIGFFGLLSVILIKKRLK